MKGIEDNNNKCSSNNFSASNGDTSGVRPIGMPNGSIATLGDEYEPTRFILFF